ncbi:tyrosine-type recombinase/integrase [Virgibacillus kimchii]
MLQQSIQNNNGPQEITEKIKKESTHITEALEEMTIHQDWSNSTIESYRNDVKKFEAYLMEMNIEPTLENGESLNFVTGWKKQQRENGVSNNTIRRRMASLASIFSLYQHLGIVKVNAFNVVKVPVTEDRSHSSVMDISELKEVYKAIQELKEEDIDVEIPIKILIFTGLRNQAISSLKVGDIDFNEGRLIYNAQSNNSKNKVQVLPIPPGLLKLLQQYVEWNHMKPEEPLCVGIKGLPLANKQLNRITNAVCEKLNWTGEKRVTPHGFRYSIATLLDERGMSKENIKYLLGHSSTDNVQFYIKRNKRKIHQLQIALKEIEDELEDSLDDNESVSTEKVTNISNRTKDREEAPKDNKVELSDDYLAEIALANPVLFQKIIKKKYGVEQTNAS